MSRRLACIAVVVALAVIVTSCASASGKPEAAGGTTTESEVRKPDATKALEAFRAAWFARLPCRPDTESARRYFLRGNDLYERIGQDYGKALALWYILGVVDALGAVYDEQQILRTHPGSDGCFAKELEGLSPDGRAWVVTLSTMDALALRLQVAVDNPKGEGVQAKQLFDIVNNYLKNHPEERNMPAAVLVWRALASVERAANLYEYSRTAK